MTDASNTTGEIVDDFGDLAGAEVAVDDHHTARHVRGDGPWRWMTAVSPFLTTTPSSRSTVDPPNFLALIGPRSA
jgi:hypothetical protein